MLCSRIDSMHRALFWDKLEDGSESCIVDMHQQRQRLGQIRSLALRGRFNVFSVASSDHTNCDAD
eukprot:2479859-Ditylum_brightwellii.AAC.1